MAYGAPPPDPPRLLSGGHVLRSDGERVASLVPALAAAPWLADQAALGRARALPGGWSAARSTHAILSVARGEGAAV